MCNNSASPTTKSDLGVLSPHFLAMAMIEPLPPACSPPPLRDILGRKVLVTTEKLCIFAGRIQKKTL